MTCIHECSVDVVKPWSSHLDVWASCCCCSVVTTCKCLYVDRRQVLSPGCSFSDRLKALHDQVGIWCYYQNYQTSSLCVLKHWPHIIDPPVSGQQTLFWLYSNEAVGVMKSSRRTSGFSPVTLSSTCRVGGERVSLSLIYMIVVCVKTGLTDSGQQKESKP